MSIELAQPHSASKAGAASKAADSRFKSGHGKSQQDALGGFQSILSAAADASSESVASGTTLLQAANDAVVKDAKDGKDTKSLLTQADDGQVSLEISAQDLTETILTEKDAVTDVNIASVANSVDVASPMPAVWMQSPLVTPQVSAPTVVADSAATDQVSALLSQSRFLPNNPANLPPSQSSQPVLNQPQEVQDVTTSPLVAATPVANMPVNNIPNQVDRSISVLGVELKMGSNVINMVQPAPIVNAVQTNLASGSNAEIAPQVTPVLPFMGGTSNAIENVKQTIPSYISLSVNSATSTLPTPAPIQPTSPTFNTKSSVAESSPSTRQVTSSAQEKTSLSSVMNASLNTVSATKDTAPASPNKTPANGVPEASASMLQSLNALAPASWIQPISSAANQEIKATEAAKVSATQVSTPSPFARLGAQEAQDRPAKATGFNEFKPWAPGAFASSSRMADTSGSGAGKDSGAGSNSSSANAMQSLGLMPQPIPSEIKFNQWTDALPPSTTNADSLVAPTVMTEREVLREEHAVFKTNQPDIVPDLQTYAPTGADNNFSLPTSDGAVPLETYVAEQVTYWINQDVQNAELKLEGIGVDPVQVHITTQGNEAFVTFTTDEQQARDALENARQQLQEMLQSQGVILSGLSVGSNGAGNSGSQERNPRQGNKQTVVASVQPSVQENKPRGGRSSGSALDLFV